MARRGSIEWKLNISRGRIGQPVWNKGLTKEIDPRVRKYAEAISISKKGSIPWNKGKKGVQVSWNKGKHLSDETKEKIRRTQLGKPNYKIRGENHYNWKNGKTKLNDQIRQSLEYRNWRRSVFERDDYTCQICRARNGNGVKVYLEADHIKQFAYYEELRFDLSNGRTLCLNCHRESGAKRR